MSTSKSHTREPLNTRQRQILMTFYNQNPYPSATERHQLVQLTGRTLKQIQDWFSNRRRNDSRLVSGKPTATSQPSPAPPMPIQPMYCYQQQSPSTMCPCCFYGQTCTTYYYYPPSNPFM